MHTTLKKRRATKCETSRFKKGLPLGNFLAIEISRMVLDRLSLDQNYLASMTNCNLRRFLTIPKKMTMSGKDQQQQLQQQPSPWLGGAMKKAFKTWRIAAGSCLGGSCLGIIETKKKQGGSSRMKEYSVQQFWSTELVIFDE
jgi:hypothetical protein